MDKKKGFEGVRELFRRKPGAKAKAMADQEGAVNAVLAGIAVLPPGAETIIVKTSVTLSKEDTEKAERILSEKTGKRVVVIPSWAGELAVVTEDRDYPRPVPQRVEVRMDAERSAAQASAAAARANECADAGGAIDARIYAADAMAERDKAAIRDYKGVGVMEKWTEGAEKAESATYYFRLPEFVARMRSYLDGKGIEYTAKKVKRPGGEELWCIDTVGAFDSATEFYLYLMKVQKNELARREVEGK